MVIRSCDECEIRHNASWDKGKSFCSLACLRHFVSKLKPMRMEDERRKFAHPISQCTSEMITFVSSDASVYSPILHQTFRSDMEAMFAEVATKVWGWRLAYEPHVFMYDGNVPEYVPDFFLIDHECWFEVKGLWRMGAKVKVEGAIEKMGEDRLIMILPQYTSELQSIAFVLRKELYT